MVTASCGNWDGEEAVGEPTGPFATACRPVERGSRSQLLHREYRQNGRRVSHSE